MRIADLMLFVVRRRDEGLEYSFRKGTLDGLLMAQGYIAQTLLKKPKSPLQRYRLLREGEGGPGMNTTYTVNLIQKGLTLFDMGGVLHEIVSSNNSWEGAIDDIKSNLIGIVHSFIPFESCEKSCECERGRWNR